LETWDLGIKSKSNTSAKKALVEYCTKRSNINLLKSSQPKKPCKVRGTISLQAKNQLFSSISQSANHWFAEKFRYNFSEGEKL